MHSYYNKMLPNYFDDYFISISSIHSHSTKLSTSYNLLLRRVNASLEKCSLTFVGPKVWSSMPDCIKSSTTFTFKWKLKKQLLHQWFLTGGARPLRGGQEISRGARALTCCTTQKMFERECVPFKRYASANFMPPHVVIWFSYGRDGSRS